LNWYPTDTKSLVTHQLDQLNLNDLLMNSGPHMTALTATKTKTTNSNHKPKDFSKLKDSLEMLGKILGQYHGEEMGTNMSTWLIREMEALKLANGRFLMAYEWMRRVLILYAEEWMNYTGLGSSPPMLWDSHADVDNFHSTCKHQANIACDTTYMHTWDEPPPDYKPDTGNGALSGNKSQEVKDMMAELNKLKSAVGNLKSDRKAAASQNTKTSNNSSNQRQERQNRNKTDRQQEVLDKVASLSTQDVDNEWKTYVSERSDKDDNNGDGKECSTGRDCFDMNNHFACRFYHPGQSNKSGLKASSNHRKTIVGIVLCSKAFYNKGGGYGGGRGGGRSGGRGGSGGRGRGSGGGYGGRRN
jgi:hypothetical protein